MHTLYPHCPDFFGEKKKYWFLSWERVRVKLKFVFVAVAPEMKPSTFPRGPWLQGPSLESELGECVGSDQFLEDE